MLHVLRIDNGHKKLHAETQLFDHLIGAGEQRRWDFEAERLRGLEVDHQLDLGGLLNWQVGGLGAALEYPVDKLGPGGTRWPRTERLRDLSKLLGVTPRAIRKLVVKKTLRQERHGVFDLIDAVRASAL